MSSTAFSSCSSILSFHKDLPFVSQDHKITRSQDQVEVEVQVVLQAASTSQKLHFTLVSNFPQLPDSAVNFSGSASSTRLDATMSNWPYVASSPRQSLLQAGMMPRLRVCARVISEDEYLAHLAQGHNAPGLYRGERKFAVVIRNPHSWRIGHLVAEIKRQYTLLYGR
jgi:hypothetical protein